MEGCNRHQPHLFRTQVGLAAAVAGASNVLLTDLSENVARMEKNIKDNAAALEEAGVAVEAQALPWGDIDAVYEKVPTGCDLVLGADLCYEVDSFPALLDTLHELALIRGARVLLATEQRWDHVNAAWKAALTNSQMVRNAFHRKILCRPYFSYYCEYVLQKQISEFELPAPTRLPRPILCVELEPCEPVEITRLPDLKSIEQESSTSAQS